MKILSAILVLWSAGAALASDLDFTVVNQTARSFEGVYITATANKDWDGNLLPEGKTLAAGGRLEVKFQPSAKSAAWDLNFVDDAGVSEQFKGVNLAHADTLTLKVVDGKITAVVE